MGSTAKLRDQLLEQFGMEEGEEGECCWQRRPNQGQPIHDVPNLMLLGDIYLGTVNFFRIALQIRTRWRLS